MAIGQRIREVRKHHLGMTQRELAQTLDVDAVTISRWERGIEPRPKYVRQIAALAELPVAYFYEETEAVA